MGEAPTCRGCGAGLGPERLACGPQPLCNRYLREPGGAEFTHPLTLGYCLACGLAQLVDPVGAEEVSPRFDWITYQEPEAHLDDLVETLGRLAGPGPHRVGGITYKDDSTLARFAGASTWRVTPLDLGLEVARAEVERVQARLSPSLARNLRDRYGAADLLLVRHILEHVHAPGPFLDALKGLVRPGGRLVFEVPDATGMLTHRDYSPLWEEHLVYFTPATLARTLARHGLQVEDLRIYPGVLERSLVAIAQVGADGAVSAPDPEEGALVRAYIGGFRGRREGIRRYFREARTRGPVALLGAGHLGCMFVNLMGLAPWIDFVVDDDPNRAGLFMPGSKLPILPGTALLEQGVALCVLSLNPLHEAKVLEKQAAFLKAGGTFRSIFPSSPLAIEVDAEGAA